MSVSRVDGHRASFDALASIDVNRVMVGARGAGVVVANSLVERAAIR